MAGAVTFETLSDVGRGRKQNEDSRGEIEAANGQLVIVCDGMGGHSAGDVASRLAVDAISQIFKNSPADDPGERLKAGFLVANQRILSHQEKEGIESMGTTAVAAFVRNGKAWIAHVGDSRCYHLRDTAIAWKTADHTRVQKMIDRGILTPEQAKTHEDANVVTRALGFTKGEDAPEPDITTRDIQDGDLLLLCSDGLYDLVKDDEIVDIGSEPAMNDSVKELVDLANRRGGHDNITVTILRQGAAKARKGVKRRTDLDEGTTEAPRSKTLPPGSASSDIAKAKAEAHAAREAAERSKRALILVVAGFALVGIAAAVFFMTRGNDEPVPVTKHDAGTGSAVAPMVDDAGAGSAVAADAAIAGSGSQTHTAAGSNTGGKKNPKNAGSGSTGSGSGSGSSSGSGSAATTVNAGSGSATPVPTNSGSGSATIPVNNGSGGFGTGTQTLGGNKTGPTLKSGSGSGSATTPPKAGSGATSPAAGTGGATTAPGSGSATKAATGSASK